MTEPVRTDLTLRLALTSVLSANVDRGGDRRGLLLAMQPAVPHAVQPARPGRPAPRVPAPRRPLDDVPGRLAAVHPLRPQLAPGGDDPAAA